MTEAKLSDKSVSGSPLGIITEASPLAMLAQNLQAEYEIDRQAERIAWRKFRSTRNWRRDFWDRVDVGAVDNCWPWLARLNQTGYGFFYWGGFKAPAHRVAYLACVGPIPKGLEVDHVCHNRAVPVCRLGNECPHRRCANPLHLEAVTGFENVQRAVWGMPK